MTQDEMKQRLADAIAHLGVLRVMVDPVAQDKEPLDYESAFEEVRAVNQAVEAVFAALGGAETDVCEAQRRLYKAVVDMAQRVYLEERDPEGSG